MGGKGTHRGMPTGPDSALPSHGELDHSKSGARPTQLRLEIWIAPDRLHSHHPHETTRRGGRDASGLETWEESPSEARGRLREAGAWTGAATTTCRPGALSAESRQGAAEPRGRRRGLGGERDGKGAQHPAATAPTEPWLRRL